MLMRHLKRWFVGRWPLRRFVWHRLPEQHDMPVALTFDDGPHPVFTPQVLDLLKHHQMRGIFFLLGHACREHPELVQRIRDEGHTIGIHGMDHTSRDMVHQVETCRRILLDMGIDTHWFRPPRGQLKVAPFVGLLVRGYRIMIWSVDTHDSMRHEGKWERAPFDPQSVQSGDILLMHDDNPICIQELPRLLERCRELMEATGRAR